ncbi:MAG TPA: hypothetical protein VH187_01560 [Scandinavium sp.]|jgi:hypothetical protein|uniref:hypothetical protein n=1 Tax=Scandinavium sp. TaxID=2830653 RepID=UPI002E322880|nr:hypothetical protein [Scandinavium sp.]HEX4499845.1 hypothetical protein [Scandinavium sp.]
MKKLHLETRMSVAEIKRIALELEPALRDWLSDVLLSQDIDPRDAVRVMSYLLRFPIALDTKTHDELHGRRRAHRAH